ncbi:MAG: MFS transporter [Patescibacteria group bacterium]
MGEALKRFRKNPLQVLFFTVFLDMVRFGILIPVIPELLANPHSPYFLLPHGLTIQNGYILLGFLTAVFPLAQFFATPIFGQLSDVYGRKKLLVISLAGTFISYLLFAYGILTRNLGLLFFSRAVDGVTGGNISVAQAAIADVTTPENRAKNFGMIGAAFGLGFILGPYIGGKLSDPSVLPFFDATTPFWFAAGLSLLNTLSVIFFFPETLKHAKAKLELRITDSVRNIAKAFSLKEIRPLFLTSLLFQGGFTFFATFFPIFLINRFAFTQGNIGDLFSYMGLWIAFTQAFITRKIAARYREDETLKITLFGVSFAVLIYFFPHSWWQLLFIVPLMAIFNGLSNVNLTGLISRSVGPKIQGEILGINASVQALAQAIPPILSGYIAASLTPSTPILVSSFVLLLAGLAFVFFYRPAAKIHPAFQPTST